MRGRTMPLLALAAALVVTACGPGDPSAPPSAATPSVSAAVTVPASSPSPAVGTVAEDPALLAILPAELDGHPVVTEEGQFQSALEDSGFVANVAAAAFMTVVSGTDLSSGMVARLRPGVFSEDFYRDWRETYDDGACGQAGGVATNAETELGGQAVHITTCAGGLWTYHAYLEQRGVIVSLFSIGEGRLGEQLMAGLRP